MPFDLFDVRVELHWNAAHGASTHTLKRATASGGPYTAITTIGDRQGATTTYTDTDVASGTTYYYVVSAANSGGDSESSLEASATAGRLLSQEQPVAASSSEAGNPASNANDGDLSTR